MKLCPKAQKIQESYARSVAGAEIRENPTSEFVADTWKYLDRRSFARAMNLHLRSCKLCSR